MADEHAHQQEGLHNPEVGHELSDVNVRGIVGFGAGLAVCVVLACLVLYGMFGLLRKGFTHTPVNANALVGTQEPLAPGATAASKLFPEPRLQTDYFGDMAKRREQWDQQLNSYGWSDAKAGIAHIPIQRAMELVVQRGLPARADATAPAMGTPTAAAGGKAPSAAGRH